MAESDPRRRVPLEALILVFSYSRAKELVGTDALRSVLSGQYRDLFRDGVFDLEIVWQLLAHQPGFKADDVQPALARFKSWEARLGSAVQVKMPAAMIGLGEAELTELGRRIAVPAHELSKVLRGLEATPIPTSEPTPPGETFSTRTPPGGSRRATPEPQPVPPTMKSRAIGGRLARLSRSQRRAVEIAAVVLGLGGFAIAGTQLYRSCGGPAEWERMPIRFAGDIPLASAQQSGPEVGGTLRDDGWLRLPEATRRSQMRAALEELPRDVRTFFVRDRAGKVRAAARWYGEPAKQIDVTFR